MTNSDHSVVTATVIRVNTYDRSNVIGMGGGGYVSGGKGHIAPVHFTTTHQRTTELWVRHGNEREERLDFPGYDIPVREGHRIALFIYKGKTWAVKNLTTDQTTWFVSAQSMAGTLRLTGVATFLIAAFVLFPVVLLLMTIMGLLLTIFGIGLPPDGGVIVGYFVLPLLGAAIFVWKRDKSARRKWQASVTAWEQWLQFAANALASAKSDGAEPTVEPHFRKDVVLPMEPPKKEEETGVGLVVLGYVGGLLMPLIAMGVGIYLMTKKKTATGIGMLCYAFVIILIFIRFFRG